MDKNIIEPKVLKGFQDILPHVARARGEMIQALTKVFSSFGYSPIDTPALEYAEILLGKGSAETDKQLYRFKDQGDRDIALRFDLTVPLARFAAMHIDQLGVPFRRYHVAPVWRAEKPQRGRYREFFQCDFDIIGAPPGIADGEVLSIVDSSMKAMNLKSLVRCNNRKILTGFFQTLGDANITAVLRVIDKLDKIGKDGVKDELAKDGALSAENINTILSFLEISNAKQSPELLFKELQTLLAKSELGLTGVHELKTVYQIAQSLGVVDMEVDLSIARGLDYYTGLVFETTLLDFPTIGSVCSGGRYDDLASLYIKRKLPGVGGSVGLDRILGALQELKRVSEAVSSAKILIALFEDEASQQFALKAAHQLRDKGINVELFPEPSSLGGQIKYADKRGIPYVLIAGEKEVAQGGFLLKDIINRTQEGPMSVVEVVNKII
jgi:histidyl-tRNA synthetase